MNSNHHISKVIACSNVFIFSGMQIILITFFPYLAENLNISVSTVIACFSVGSFSFLWSSPFWASKSDWLGRRKVLALGFFGFATSILILLGLLRLKHYFKTEYLVTLLLLSRVIYGFMASAIVPVSQALQAELSENNQQNAAMYRHSLSLSIGRAAGLIITLLIGKTIEPILLAYALCGIVLIGLNLYITKQNEKALSIVQDCVSLWSQVLKIKWIFLLALCFTCFVEALSSSLAIQLKHTFFVDSIEAGKLMAKLLLCNSAIIVFSQLLAQLKSFGTWKFGLLVGVGSLTAGSICFVTMRSEAQLWVSVGLLSLGMGLIPPNYLTRLSLINHVSGRQGSKAGVIGSAHTLGYALGGFMTSMILKLDISKVNLLILSIAALIMICTAIILYHSILESYFVSPNNREDFPNARTI
jgi:MFS family permease